MIIDNIINAGLYYGMGERIQKALKYIEETDFSGIEPGKYEIDGDNVFAIVQEYKTKPFTQGQWEAHKKYTDIQYMAEGAEQIGYFCVRDREEAGEYDEDSDFVSMQGTGSMLLCKKRTFAVFTPEDVHMPGINAEKEERVKKVVVKVKRY